MWIAEFAGESVANIRASKELSEDQLSRLSSALTKVFGRELQLNVEIDQEIIGGLHITVNGEVLDATVLDKNFKTQDCNSVELKPTSKQRNQCQS